jgi:hypothetical protein
MAARFWPKTPIELKGRFLARAATFRDAQISNRGSFLSLVFLCRRFRIKNRCAVKRSVFLKCAASLTSLLCHLGRQ